MANFSSNSCSFRSKNSPEPTSLFEMEAYVFKLEAKFNALQTRHTELGTEYSVLHEDYLGKILEHEYLILECNSLKRKIRKLESENAFIRVFNNTIKANEYEFVVTKASLTALIEKYHEKRATMDSLKEKVFNMLKKLQKDGVSIPVKIKSFEEFSKMWNTGFLEPLICNVYSSVEQCSSKSISNLEKKDFSKSNKSDFAGSSSQTQVNNFRSSNATSSVQFRFPVKMVPENTHLFTTDKRNSSIDHKTSLKHFSDETEGVDSFNAKKLGETKKISTTVYCNIDPKKSPNEEQIHDETFLNGSCAFKEVLGGPLQICPLSNDPKSLAINGNTLLKPPPSGYRVHQRGYDVIQNKNKTPTQAYEIKIDSNREFTIDSFIELHENVVLIESLTQIFPAIPICFLKKKVCKFQSETREFLHKVPFYTIVEEILHDGKPPAPKEGFCYICLMVLEEAESLRLHCHDCFHKVCVYGWLQFSKNCPLCKKAI